MKIEIDGRKYILTDQSIQAILKSIEVFASEQYDKLPNTAKLAAMATVRAMLAYAESKEHEPAKKMMIRPPKGVDPAMHLLKLLLNYVGEALPHVECAISAEGQNITNFSFKHAGEGGGSLSVDGNVRQWEDHSRQTDRQEIS